MSKKIVILLIAVSSLVIGTSLVLAAETVHLNTKHKTIATQGVKKVALTPAIAQKGFGAKELEKGQIVGVIETENIDNIPNGKYNIFVAKAGNTWQAHLESNGKIVAKSKSVKVTQAAEIKKPEIEFNLRIYIAWDSKHIWIEL